MCRKTPLPSDNVDRKAALEIDHGEAEEIEFVSDNTRPDSFVLRVDPKQAYKASEFKIFSFARPHMRAFHYSWWSFFCAFFVWLSIAPLLPEIQKSLSLSPRQIWITNIVAICGDIVMRSVFGSLTDRYGSRVLMGGVLMAASIPTACTGLVNSFGGLCVLRLLIGLAGSSFVMCQCWTTRMFTKEIVGTVNALVAGWGGAGAFAQVVIGTVLFPLFRDVFFSNAEDPTERAWRTVCIVPAIVAFVTGIVVIKTSDDCPEGNYKVMVQQKKMRRQSATDSFKTGAIDFNTWLLFLQYGCSFGVELTMHNAAATYFVTRFDLGIGSAAAITSIFGIVNLFARALGGYWSDIANARAGMKGRAWVQFGLLFSQGLCILLFPIMNQLWSAIAVLAIMSILTLCAEGSTYGIVPYVNSSSPGAVAGMVGSGGASVAVLFGLGFVFFEDFRHAYFLMGGLVLLGACSALLLNIRGHGGIIVAKTQPSSLLLEAEIGFAFSESELSNVRPEYRESMKDFRYLLDGTKKRTLEYYQQCGNPKNQTITKYAMPEDIRRQLGSITNEGQSNDECLRIIDTVFEYSVKNLSPYYLDKLGQSTDPIGQVSELVTAVINNNAHVYHAAPVASVMERECIKILGRAFGFLEANIDGVLAPGGSAANTIALLAARHKAFPHVREEGWKPEDKPVCYAPAQAHYSIARAVVVAGFGLQNLRKIPGGTKRGGMDVSALEEAIRNDIAEGYTPFFVVGLSGTTVLGSFDDQDAIAFIAKKYNLWHHIDACWGGFLNWADDDKKNHLFEGVDKSDSISFNPHKGWGVPQQCAAIITNGHTHALRAANQSGAEYLFVDSPTAEYDIGDKSLQCGRRTDGIKLYLTLKKHGFDGLRRIANNSLDLARYVTHRIREHANFEMVHEPMGTNVCFWYIPPYYREHPAEWTDRAKRLVHKHLYVAQQKDGACLICVTPLLDSVPEFLRLVLKSGKIDAFDMDFLLDEIDRLGRNITPPTLENV